MAVPRYLQRVRQQLPPQPQVDLDLVVVFEPIGVAHASTAFLQVALDLLFQRTLDVAQPAVQALARQQLVVRPLLNQSPAIEHEDPIRQPRRREPMRNQNRRLLPLARRERLQNPRLGLRVDRAQAVVEHEKRRSL